MSINLLSAILGKFYSTASNARRAARAAGVDFDKVTQTADGWTVVVAPAANTTGDQLGGQVVADMPLPAAPVAPVAKPNWAQSKLPAHKAFANYAHSSAAKPVHVVHSYLDANPDLTRKAALVALCEMGVNYHTARTQYQVWFKNRAK